MCWRLKRVEEAIFKVMDMDNANIYLLNGVNLGRIRNLR